jgi:carboxypeptidase Taq
MNKLALLREMIKDIKVLTHSSLNASWYQQTMMPKDSLSAVSLFHSTYQKLRQEKLQSKEFKDLLSAFIDIENGQIKDPNLSRENRRMILLAYRDWKKERNIPADFAENYSKLQAKLFHTWKQSRVTHQFSDYQQTLVQMFKTLKHKATFINPYIHPYDVLLNEYEPGLTISKLEPLFKDYKKKTFLLLNEIKNTGIYPKEIHPLNETFDKETQIRFIKDHVVPLLGFDINRGMIHQSLHPFCIGVHPDDVKIALRPIENTPYKAILSAMHEIGHGLYEQNLSKGEFWGLPQSSVASYGIHESQARFYHTCIGLSQEFWEYLLPKLQETFPNKVDSVTPKDVFEGLNRIKLGPIRNASDELTFHLHILIRYEVEKEILEMDEDKITIEKIRELWNQKYKDHLGVNLENKSDFLGFMQDVHWCHGCVGYFPTYFIGDLAASQLFQKINEEIPDLKEKFKKGDLSSVNSWLKEKIHRQGALKDPSTLMIEAIGKPLSTDSFFHRISLKLSKIYGFDPQKVLSHTPEKKSLEFFPNF